jgi:ABC-type antimicrobial peptide transport system permease subunit
MAFGVAALVLAVLGVYGVKSYLVACRRREIAIRVAVGASSLDILRLVVSDGAWLTLTGLGVGLALAAALCQMLGSWVYGVPGMNAGVLLFASAVLATSSLAAAYLPARRGARVAPITALGRE